MQVKAQSWKNKIVILSTLTIWQNWHFDIDNCRKSWHKHMKYMKHMNRDIWSNVEPYKKCWNCYELLKPKMEIIRKKYNQFMNKKKNYNESAQVMPYLFSTSNHKRYQTTLSPSLFASDLLKKSRKIKKLILKSRN